MNIYDLIKKELSAGVGRPTDIEIYKKYSQYSGNVISQALKYAYGIIEKPSITGVIFHASEVMIAPDNEIEYEELCGVIEDFHRFYWLDDKILENNKLNIEDAMTILDYYLNSEEQGLAPIFICGGL